MKQVGSLTAKLDLSMINFMKYEKSYNFCYMNNKGKIQSVNKAKHSLLTINLLEH